MKTKRAAKISLIQLFMQGCWSEHGPYYHDYDYYNYTVLLLKYIPASI